MVWAYSRQVMYVESCTGAVPSPIRHVLNVEDYVAPVVLERGPKAYIAHKEPTFWFEGPRQGGFRNHGLKNERLMGLYKY